MTRWSGTYSTPALPMTEAQLQTAVIDLLRLTGFTLVYHTHDSRRSHPGFPDLIALKGPRMICAELKSDIGKATEAQLIWLEAFAQIPGVESHLWRPQDLRDGTISKALTRSGAYRQHPNII
jgi:hypothetical protein